MRATLGIVHELGIVLCTKGRRGGGTFAAHTDGPIELAQSQVMSVVGPAAAKHLGIHLVLGHRLGMVHGIGMGIGRRV